MPKGIKGFQKRNQFAKGNPPNKTSFKKGKIPWNKGIPMSKLTIKKIHLKNLGKHFSKNTEFKKGMSSWNKGLKGYNAGKSHYNWQGGKVVTSTGYILIYKPEHPFRICKNYVFEHRLVMEMRIGRYLTSKEIVHHINFNPIDNRIENLKLCANIREHKKFHKVNKTVQCHRK